MDITTEQTTKRRGMLYVSTEVWEGINKPDTNEAWHKALLLPENYEIERIYQNDEKFYNIFEIAILTDAIPESDSHIAQVELIPFYVLDNEVERLIEIRIVEWDGEKHNLLAYQEFTA